MGLGGARGGSFKQHCAACKGPGMTARERALVIEWRNNDWEKNKCKRWAKKSKERLALFLAGPTLKGKGEGDVDAVCACVGKKAN